MAKRFRIHPGIGAARVGNAPPDTFFFGPEKPGVPALFDVVGDRMGPFKQDGRVRPQAARFRVFEYDEIDGRIQNPREIDLSTAGIVRIDWTAHLANSKSAFFTFDGPKGEVDRFASRADDLRNPTVTENRAERLVIDPGPRSISGRSQQGQIFENPTKEIPIDRLGELRTDDVGNLIVIGGQGQSESSRVLGGPAPVGEYANNDTWFDDVADGPVRARVTVASPQGEETFEADPAWVIVGPPDFGPGIGNVVTLWDTLADLAVRELAIPTDNDLYNSVPVLRRLRDQASDWKQSKSLTSYSPSFTDDIYPILRRAMGAPAGHDGGVGPFHHTFGVAQWPALADPAQSIRRDNLFKKVRDPDATVVDPRQMPKGLGDDNEDEPAKRRARSYFSLTRLQYALLRRWRDGAHDPAWQGVPPLVDQPINPVGLDVAALENCVGGPFFPGIEVSWIVRFPELYAEPFRFRHGATAGPITVEPGFLTQQMALPWQADFFDCQKQLTVDPDSGDEMFHMWWSAQRPDDVRLAAGGDQVPWTRRLKGKQGDVVGYQEMLDKWSTLGFVVIENGDLVEREGT
jgi:hypothetical protein